MYSNAAQLQSDNRLCATLTMHATIVRLWAKVHKISGEYFHIWLPSKHVAKFSCVPCGGVEDALKENEESAAKYNGFHVYTRTAIKIYSVSTKRGPVSHGGHFVKS